MDNHISPLRYPGGKTALWKYLNKVIQSNELVNVAYIEPFAGGAGAALNLLTKGFVDKIVLNDLDERIYKFWKAVLNQTDGFIARVISTPVKISEWKIQRDLLKDKEFIKHGSDIDVGFASFYLNRCNRSGILSSGPVGGMKQDGEWKIDARFNKINLIKRIELISKYKSKIELFNKDGVDFLKTYLALKSPDKSNYLIYLDPPYYQKGRDLYKYYMEAQEHERLSNYLKENSDLKWVLSYDNIAFIKNIYKGVQRNNLKIRYSIHKASIGKELLISSENCILPKIKNKHCFTLFV